MMYTFQIANHILDGYKESKLTQDRLDELTTQADEQLNEIAQNEELYNSFLKKVNAPKDVDNIVLWMLLMSNEDICCSYIDEFNKDFREIIPVSDLADLLLYLVYLNKVQNRSVNGFDYLETYKEDGMEEVDQYAFTNALLYVQKSKEVEIEF